MVAEHAAVFLCMYARNQRSDEIACCCSSSIEDTFCFYEVFSIIPFTPLSSWIPSRPRRHPLITPTVGAHRKGREPRWRVFCLVHSFVLLLLLPHYICGVQ